MRRGREYRQARGSERAIDHREQAFVRRGLTARGLPRLIADFQTSAAATPSG